MSGRLQYKILKNQPYYNAYGQYYYNENDLQDFYQGSGLETILTSDDVYAVVDSEGNAGSGETTEENWRPIANVFIGNPTDIDNPNNESLLKYHEFGSNQYIKTSAPNLVYLSFDLSSVYSLFDVEILNYYNIGNTGTIGFKVINWDWNEGDYDTSIEFFSPTVDSEYTDLYQNDNQTPNYLSHQYDSPGLKTIKATVFSEDNGGRIRYKHITIKIFLGLDGIFVEDFIDVGGPDFNYLPWPTTSPIIGGVSEKSEYYKSIKKIINSNQFNENEKLEKYFAQKAFYNDELGESLGDTDIEQVRAFKGGRFDMHYLLGLGINQIVVNDDFFPYTNEDYWNGEDRLFMETSVGKLFIDESEDLSLTESSIFEFNCGNVDISNILDTSGNGNKAILIGDFKVNKERGIKARRDSVLQTPKTDSENGAI